MIELVEDTLLAGGLRKMRWMSEAPIPVPSPISDEIGEGGCRRWGDEKLGVHYLEVVYPYRGPVEIRFPWPVNPVTCPVDEPKMIRMLAWSINGEKISKCMQEGAAEFASSVGRWPRDAYIKTLPKGAEHGVEVDGVMLLEVDWVLEGYLFIGG